MLDRVEIPFRFVAGCSPSCYRSGDAEPELLWVLWLAVLDIALRLLFLAIP